MDYPGVRTFARRMLAKGLPIQPDLSRILVMPLGTECVIYRDAPWQISIVTMPPNTQIPRHRHNRMDSAELVLGGSGLANIDQRVAGATQRGNVAANLIRVPRGKWHEGHTGPNGCVYLSFQHWIGEPGHICEDWEQ